MQVQDSDGRMVWYGVRASCPRMSRIPRAGLRECRTHKHCPRFAVHGSRSMAGVTHLYWPTSKPQASGPRSLVLSLLSPSILSTFHCSLSTVHFQLSACAYQCWLLGRLWVPLGMSRGRRAVDGFFFPFMSTVHPPHVPLIPLYPPAPAPHPLSCSSCSERAPHQAMDTVSRTVDSHALSRSFTSLRYRSSSSFRGVFSKRCPLFAATAAFRQLPVFRPNPLPYRTRQVPFPYPHHPSCPPHSQVTARTSYCVS